MIYAPSFSQQHCPGSAFTNHGAAPSANSRKTALCGNLIQWCTITHTAFGSTARGPCDDSVSAATARVFHSSFLCREGFVKLAGLPQTPLCLPPHCRVLSHPAAGASTRAVKFLKSKDHVSLLHAFSPKCGYVTLLNPNPASNCTSRILELTFSLHKQ